MAEKNTNLNTRLLEMANAAEPYTPEEMRVYDDDKDLDRLFATVAKYALEHPNPKLKDKHN